MFCVLTSHLELIPKPLYCIQDVQISFMSPGNHQGNKGSSVHSNKLSLVDPKLHFAQTAAEVMWLKWNSNKTGVFMPLIQRIYSTKDSSIPIQFRRDKNGRCLYLKTPKCLHTVYTNKSAWKTEGLAQSVLNMVTTFMDRDACLDNLLVYVQIKIKVEEDELSLCLLCLTKKQKNLI